MTTYDRKEAFRQWIAISVSALALLVTCLRGPLSATFRATVQEVLRQELAHRDTGVIADTGRKSQDSTNEALARLEREIATLRADTNATETTRRLVIDLSNCLVAIEAKVDQLAAERQRDAKTP